MAVVKRRGAAKKLGPISLGRRFIRFKTNNNDRQFSIHEDLLCANSEFFKDRFQKARKKVEGECSICHGDMDPRHGDITFCRASCGQNIHEKCMEQWNGSRPGRSTCPLCRKFWKQKSEDIVALDQDLDTDAVQLYLDWLYTGKLITDKDFDPWDEELELFLLKAWTVSEVMKDEDFRYALVAEYVEKVSEGHYDGFWIASANYAFEEHFSPTMQTFVISAFLEEILPGWFDKFSSKFPTKFTAALFKRIVLAVKEDGYGKLLNDHTKGEYEIEDEKERV